MQFFLQIQTQPITLSTADIIVLISYALVMIGIGWHYQRRNKTKEDYLLGGRNMKASAVGISLFATLVSTLSYLMYPGEMILHGPVIFIGALAFPLVYWVVGWWLIPAIMKTGVTSAYEILEIKLGLSVRMLGTVMFIALRLLWMATIIYVTVDLALHAVLPFDKQYSLLIATLLTAVTIAYTSMGGLRAVVVTDIIQSGIFVTGALLTILLVCWQLPSLRDFFPAGWQAQWAPFKWGFDPKERTTLGNAMVSVFVWYLCTNGSDQIAVQRYLATPDAGTARRSFKVALCADFVSSVLLGLVGIAMLAYFSLHPQWLQGKPVAEQADQLFPRFILLALPPGVSGLVIAGILAAAMSSLSSGMSSMASVISEDVISRLGKKKVHNNPMRQIRMLSILIGVVVLLLSLLVGQVQGNLMDVIMKVVNLFAAPLFVLFFMALFVPFATATATFCGGLIGLAIAIAAAFWQIAGITVMWIMPVSLVAGIAAALLLSWTQQWIKQKSSSSNANS